MELGKMNYSKRGGQFKFPKSLMKRLAVWKQLVDYRVLEGITSKIYQLGLVPNILITQPYGIAARPDISLPNFDKTGATTDGSGLKTRNSGEYRMFKYGDKDASRKKHLVVVIAADMRKKLLCVDVCIVGKRYIEASIGLQHISFITERGIGIKKFYGDGAFDQSTLLDKLHSLGTEPIIKIRKNSSIDYYNGSKFCRKIVKEYRIWGMKDDTH
ncbi:MAG: hypothetical protein QW578_02910 [Thermoplasmatales archaeon]